MFRFKNRRQCLENTALKISWGHWFVFFNSLWLILIGSRYAFLIDWPPTLLGKVYFFVSLIGHFSFLTFAFYLLLLFPLSFLIKNERTYRGISVVLATLGMSLLLVDTEVFASFHFHLSSLVWNLLVNPENGELARQWQLFFTPLPFMLLVQMVYSRWSWQKLRSLERQKWLKFVGVFYLLAFLITHLMFAWADATSYRPITMQKSNFPLSYPMTARSFLQRHGFLESHSPQATGKNPISFKMYYPKAPLHFSVAEHKPNILFITLTGWQKDNLTPQNMPLLYRYLPQATPFTRHYSTGKNTQSGLFGLFYGLFSVYQESTKRRNITPILLQTLVENHYIFCAFLDSKQPTLLTDLRISPTHYQQLGGQSCSPASLNFVDFPQTSPWFIFLNAHLPNGEDSQNSIQEMETLDRTLSEIFAKLDWQKTLVVLTGVPNDEVSLNEDKQGFSRQRIEVPMFVFWKDLPKEKVEKLTSHLDIVPAIMQSLFKVQNPVSDYSQGQNLFRLPKNRPWVYAGDQYWNVMVMPNGEQYFINRKGDYQKFNEKGEKVILPRSPLGLFLDFYQKEGNFWTK